MKKILCLLAGLCPALLFAQPFQITLHGKISVNAKIDSTADRSGFQILSVERAEAKLDTLGITQTNAAGDFALRITAKERGVYPVFIIRDGTLLAQSEIVVAQEDSARAEIRLPANGGRFFIRSVENAAWLAFNNTRALYENQLLEAVRSDSTSISDLKNITEFMANMLWNLSDTFPENSVGVQLGKAESVVKLMGWNDSLAVARAKTLPFDSPGFVEVARATRRGISRLEGQESAIIYLKNAQENINSADKFASLFTEIIQTRIDSLQQTEALAEIKAMKEAYPEGQWQEWANLAEREVSVLLPGLFAPDFALDYQDKTATVKNIRLSDNRGKVVVLEFWAPTSKGYIEQASLLEAQTEKLKDKPLTWLSLSIDQSIENNTTFLTGRNMPGMPIILPNADMLKLYNIRAVPMWVLIDKEGKMVKKYLGNQLGAMLDELGRQIEKVYTAPAAPANPR